MSTDIAITFDSCAISIPLIFSTRVDDALEIAQVETYALTTRLHCCIRCQNRENLVIILSLKSLDQLTLPTSVPLKRCINRL